MLVDDLATATLSTDEQQFILRAAGDYVLASANLLATVGRQDVLTGLVFLAILQANLRHLNRGPTLLHCIGPDGVPPDDLRRSVSVYAVAKELDLPYETTRRHVRKLISGALCVRVADGGLTIPAAAFARQEVRRAADMNWAATRRFLAALCQLKTLTRQS